MLLKIYRPGHYCEAEVLHSFLNLRTEIRDGKPQAIICWKNPETGERELTDVDLDTYRVAVELTD